MRGRTPAEKESEGGETEAVVGERASIDGADRTKVESRAGEPMMLEPEETLAGDEESA